MLKEDSSDRHSFFSAVLKQKSELSQILIAILFFPWNNTPQDPCLSFVEPLRGSFAFDLLPNSLGILISVLLPFLPPTLCMCLSSYFL